MFDNWMNFEHETFNKWVENSGILGKILTWAWVNRTRRFRLWVSGNCIGLESLTLHAASPDIFDICPIDPPADPPINLVTANKNENNVLSTSS